MSKPTELPLDLCYLRHAPPDEVVSELSAEISRVNEYPSGDYTELKSRLAAYAGVDQSNVIAGNGLDEVIDSITRVWGRDVCIPVPTFSQFELAASRRGSTVRHRNCLLPDSSEAARVYGLRFSRDELAKATLVWICSPNNPTGTLIPREDIVRVVEDAAGMVAIDECYYEFCGQTVVDLVASTPNLIVLRSFSKSFGIAGLRLGFAVSQSKNIRQLEQVRQIFNVNRLAEKAGLVVLRYEEQYRKIWAEVTATRDKTATALRKAGFAIHPSSANFLLLEFSDRHSAEDTWQTLIARGIRTFPGWSEEFVGLGDEFIRISIGTPGEMERVTEALCS